MLLKAVALPARRVPPAPLDSGAASVGASSIDDQRSGSCLGKAEGGTPPMLLRFNVPSPVPLLFTVTVKLALR